MPSFYEQLAAALAENRPFALALISGTKGSSPQRIGAKAYYVGKPNPLIMRHALRKLDCRREDAVIIGDRMDTDIIAGIESEIETVLVLTGVTAEADLKRFAYRPGHVLKNVGEIVG